LFGCAVKNKSRENISQVVPKSWKSCSDPVIKIMQQIKHMFQLTKELRKWQTNKIIVCNSKTTLKSSANPFKNWQTFTLMCTDYLGGIKSKKAYSSCSFYNYLLLFSATHITKHHNCNV